MQNDAVDAARRGAEAWLSAEAPLAEICPAASGDAAAAFGFALSFALMGQKGLMVWAGPEHLGSEHGVLYPDGLAQFGADLKRILFVSTRNQADALWTAEQALQVPSARVLCVIAPALKSLSLTATRRLLLAAEKRQSRCTLIRLDTLTASAAWRRFAVASAPSEGEERELGAPAFDVRLLRNRAGPSDLFWRLTWNPHDRAFSLKEGALDGAVAQPVFNRPDPPRLRRTV